MSQVVLSPIVPRALTSLWVIHRLCDQPYVGLDPAVGHAWWKVADLEGLTPREVAYQGTLWSGIQEEALRG